MKAYLHLALCALLLLGRPVQAQSLDLLRMVNQLRAPGGACAAHAPPLVPQARLDLAASRVAHGAALKDALKVADYRTNDAQVITIRSQALRSRLEAMLVGQFCDLLGDPGLSELGVHESPSQIWIVLAAPFAPAIDLQAEPLAERVLVLVNQARAQARKCGNVAYDAARPLKLNGALQAVAAEHASDMAAHNYFSHAGRDGSTPDERVRRNGYAFQSTGENIAAGHESAQEAVSAWIQSPGHCANLMNKGFTEMGAAEAVNAASEMGSYWVQVFASPR